MFLTASLVVVLVAVAELWRRWRSVHTHHTDKIPGPPCLPIIGNVHQLEMDGAKFYEQIREFWEKYGKKEGIFRFWISTQLYCYISKPEFVEKILASTKQLSKAQSYDLMIPWIGVGLLLSSGEKWKSRRKLITPTFHFKILNDFMNVFNEQSVVLVEVLRKVVREGKQTDQFFHFDISPYICRCALQIICLTAMGIDVNCQKSGDSAYTVATRNLGDTLIRRMKQPWTWYESLFTLTPWGRRYASWLKTVHEFTDKVIEERSVIMDQLIASGEAHEYMKRIDFGQTCKSETTSEIKKDLDDDVGIKRKRMVFMDMLLYSAKTTGCLTKEDIREEVDTFMFEGHDTTAAAMSFIVYMLGLHEDVQERLNQEVLSVVGEKDRNITAEDLPNLKYMECVIKETTRIYPAVPEYGRKLTEDMDFGGYTIPPDSIIIVEASFLHRDAQQFPEPEKFDPDRWLPENVSKRHPFSYVPFSAGPRNCIGQKFALMELKVELCHLVKNFRIKSLHSREQIRPALATILRSSQGIIVELHEREINKLDA